MLQIKQLPDSRILDCLKVPQKYSYFKVYIFSDKKYLMLLTGCEKKEKKKKGGTKRRVAKFFRRGRNKKEDHSTYLTPIWG